GKSAGSTTLTKLSLRIHGSIELVRVAGKIGIVPKSTRIVVDAARSRTRNDGLQLADFAIAEGVRRLAEVIRKSSGKRQLVQRMDPVGSEIIEFPVRMHVALLHGVIRTHALVDGHNIRLLVGEVIRFAGEVRRLTVCGEEMPRDIAVVSHLFELFGILRRNL